MAAKTPVKVATKATTSTSRAALIKKALAESNKSAGMRMLFDAGMTVVDVREAFNAPYGFVYGVALRHGVADTAASRRAPRKSQATKAKAVAKKVSATKPSTASIRTARAAKAPRTPRATKTTTKRVVAARPNLSKAARTRVASAR